MAATDLRDRTIMITGASNGIGRAAARALADRGAELVLVCRDRERGGKTREDITRATGNDKIDLSIADLSSQEQVRKLANEYLASHRPLHVLLNNAGALFFRRRETVDGIEMHFALNHLAYFLLANLLRARLEESGESRIVNVASDAYESAGGRLDFDDLEARRRYKPLKAYGASKLANILFTRELARRLEGTGVTANCLHPGLVASGLTRNNGWVGRFGMTLMRPFSRSPERGAETAVYLCAAAEVAGVTGECFYDGKPMALKPAATNDEDARRLWKLSAAITGLSDE
jgi:NAD(P)-dependent dehydrogenase (short-subunit alcohol dehydrogenase family)